MAYRSRTASRIVGTLLTAAVLGGTAACTADGAAGDRSGASARPDAATVAAVQRAVTKGAGLNSLSYRVSGKVPGQGAVKGKASFSLRPRVVEMRMTASGACRRASSRCGSWEMRCMSAGAGKRLPCWAASTGSSSP